VHPLLQYSAPSIKLFIGYIEAIANECCSRAPLRSSGQGLESLIARSIPPRCQPEKKGRKGSEVTPLLPSLTDCCKIERIRCARIRQSLCLHRLGDRVCYLFKLSSRHQHQPTLFYGYSDDSTTKTLPELPSPSICPLLSSSPFGGFRDLQRAISGDLY
jgi:hypothetical protein